MFFDDIIMYILLLFPLPRNLLKLMPFCHTFRQSHLRPHPVSHSAQWSLACDMANDLGLSGMPSVLVWEKVEREMTKKLSNIVAESTVQSPVERIVTVEKIVEVPVERIVYIQCVEETAAARLQNIENMLEHLQQHLGLQCPVPNGIHPVAEDMRKSVSNNATAQLDEVKLAELVAQECAPEALLTYSVASPAKPLPLANTTTKTLAPVILSMSVSFLNSYPSDDNDSINMGGYGQQDR